MTFNRRQWPWLIVIALAIASGVVVILIISEHSAPLQDYQDRTAFLYNRPNAASIPALIALLSIAIGLWMFLRSLWQQADMGRVVRVYSAGALALGIFLSIVAGPVFLRDAEKLVVLSEAGISVRENGKTETLPWSSLHHLEFRCFGGGRSRPPSPIVTLRLTNGRALPELTEMRPVRGTRQEAWAVFEMVRERLQTPIIWQSAYDEMLFREGRWNRPRCADVFVKALPAGSRAALLEMLSSGADFREQTLASYKSAR